MVSLLQSAIKQKIATAFRGKLLSGTVRREVKTGLNSYGDPVFTVSTYAFTEGIREFFSASFMARAGIPETDVSILILLGTISVQPISGDKVFISTPINKWYQVRRVMEIDPAGASIKLQCFEIETP